LTRPARAHNQTVDNQLVVKQTDAVPTDSLSTTLFALADPTRRAILARLASGDATVKELAAPHEMSQAAVSKHIKVLERAGLISRRKESQWRPCHLEGTPLQGVADWVDEYRRFWDRSFDALKDYVKAMQPQAESPRGKRPDPRKRRTRG
jgi:DNA-binding transcriptional ArsR family regulator